MAWLGAIQSEASTTCDSQSRRPPSATHTLAQKPHQNTSHSTGWTRSASSKFRRPRCHCYARAPPSRRHHAQRSPSHTGQSRSCCNSGRPSHLGRRSQCRRRPWANGRWKTEKIRKTQCESRERHNVVMHCRTTHWICGSPHSARVEHGVEHDTADALRPTILL